MKETGYCLNNEVIFMPAQRVLFRRDGKTNPVILNHPTSEILKILLTNNGITPQKKLYESAWKNNGAKTTPNNLYQNFSLLRRSLNNIFLRKVDYIITVPRKGFCISPDMSITIIHDEYDRPLACTHRLSSPQVKAAGGLPYPVLSKKMRWLRNVITGSINKHRKYSRSLFLIIFSILMLHLYHVIASTIWENPVSHYPASFCDKEKQPATGNTFQPFK